MKNLISILMILSVFFVVSCTKSPEEIQSPGLKIDVVKDNKVESYTLRVSGGIKNENSDTALLDFTGRLNFIDPSHNDRVVASIPFKLPVILPFDSAVIDETVTKSEKELEPILTLLNISREELMKEKSVEKFNILNRFVKLDSVSYKTKGIISLLKEKINEKN